MQWILILQILISGFALAVPACLVYWFVVHINSKYRVDKTVNKIVAEDSKLSAQMSVKNENENQKMPVVIGNFQEEISAKHSAWEKTEIKEDIPLRKINMNKPKIQTSFGDERIG